MMIDRATSRGTDHVLRVPKLSVAIGRLTLLLLAIGCGNGSTTQPQQPSTQPIAPTTYLAPLIGGTTNNGTRLFNPLIFNFDDVANTFTESTYALDTFQEGTQIQFAGQDSSGPRGLLELEFTANYNFVADSSSWVATDYPLPGTTKLPSGGFALELSGQAGALVQLEGQPAAPLVPTSTCPSIATAQSFNFLTIPTSFPATQSTVGWTPATDTAYGSVDITSKAGVVSLDNIQQSTFPSAFSAPGITPASPSPVSIAALCGQTAYGNTISIPGQITVTNPGANATSPPQGIANIGPTGLLVEDNGLSPAFGTYQNALGAGVGSVGLPVPSSALETGTLVAAQYLGFTYGSGVNMPSFPNSGWSSHLTSFGFSTVPLSCALVAPASPTLIYGGDFAQDILSSDGFGQCDLAIDLGTQDKQNGLYPHATVYMTTTYAGNLSNTNYSFPAVAIAGQLQGKAAIFVLGVDSFSQQAWSIDLFQSN